MSVSKSMGSPDKCCDEVNMHSPPEGGGDPPIFGPKETWDLCYGGGGQGLANQTGPTIADQITDLFNDLKPDCRTDFKDAIQSSINNQVTSILLGYINNPILNCPAGSCRQIEFGLFETPDTGGGNGTTKVCCKDGELDTSNGDPTQGWTVGTTSVSSCG